MINTNIKSSKEFFDSLLQGIKIQSRFNKKTKKQSLLSLNSDNFYAYITNSDDLQYRKINLYFSIMDMNKYPDYTNFVFKDVKIYNVKKIVFMLKFLNFFYCNEKYDMLMILNDNILLDASVSCKNIINFKFKSYHHKFTIAEIKFFKPEYDDSFYIGIYQKGIFSRINIEEFFAAFDEIISTEGKKRNWWQKKPNYLYLDW